MGNRLFFSLDITDSMLTQYSPTFVNPIPTGYGRNQPIYERHVTESGRNRVKGGIKSALTVYHAREALNPIAKTCLKNMNTKTVIVYVFIITLMSE